MISKILVPSYRIKTANKAAAYAVDLAKQLKAAMIALSAGEISVLLKLEKQAKIIAA